MPLTYTPIKDYILTSATAEIDFTSISGSYTDLVLIINGAITTGNPAILFRLNGNTGSNYSYTRITGNGTAAASSREINQTFGHLAPAFGFTTNFESNIIANFMNYSNSTTNKTIITRNNTPSAGTEALVALWRQTSAITSIKIYNSSATNFIIGSTFSLYGILKA